MTRKRPIFLSITALILILLLSACGSNSPETNNSTPPTDSITPTIDATPAESSTQENQGDGNGEGELKKIEKIGNLEVTVNKIQGVTSKGNSKPAPNNVFFIVSMTIKNTGDTKINLNRFLNFSLVDSRGNKGQALVAVDWVAQDYAPSQERTGEAGFEIKDDPDGDADYTFTFKLESSQITWSFKRTDL